MLEQAVNKNYPPLFRPPDSRILGSRNKQIKKNPVIKGLYKKLQQIISIRVEYSCALYYCLNVISVKYLYRIESLGLVKK